MQSLNVFEKGIGYLEACLQYYSGACGFLMLFLLALLYIFIKGDEREKRLFLPSSIFLLLTVYNPIAPVILDRFFDVNSEYYRFFWIAPVIILVPYLAVKLIFDTKTRKERAAVSFLLIMILVFSGKFIYKDGFNTAENIYKMPDELIEISEIIHEDSENEYAKAFLDYYYNMQMRQYDPKILLTVDREEYMEAMSGKTYTEEELADETKPQYKLLAVLARYQSVSTEDFLNALESTHTEYVVVSKNHLLMNYIRSTGLKQIAETQNSYVFKYELKEPYKFELVDYSVVY